MKDYFLAAIAIAALAAGGVSAAYSVRTADYCPQPSAASVTALFAPCQAFETAMGPAITADEAMDMGLPRLDEQPAAIPAKQPDLTPEQLVAEDFQSIAREHATAGVANSKR
jgi:hypothetical protein